MSCLYFVAQLLDVLRGSEREAMSYCNTSKEYQVWSLLDSIPVDNGYSALQAIPKEALVRLRVQPLLSLAGHPKNIALRKFVSDSIDVLTLETVFSVLFYNQGCFRALFFFSV